MFELVRADGVAYLTGPSSPAFNGGWLRFDENNERFAALGADLDSPAPTTGLALVDSMAAPTSAAASGSSTEYSTTIPAADVRQLLSASFVAEQVLTGKITAPTDPVPATVTLDTMGRLAAIEYDLTAFVREMSDQLASGVSAREASGRHTVSVDRFGEPVDIRKPSEDEIIDPDEFGQ